MVPTPGRPSGPAVSDDPQDRAPGQRSDPQDAVTSSPIDLVGTASEVDQFVIVLEQRTSEHEVQTWLERLPVRRGHPVTRAEARAHAVAVARTRALPASRDSASVRTVVEVGADCFMALVYGAGGADALRVTVARILPLD